MTTFPEDFESAVASTVGSSDWYALFDSDARCVRLHRGALGRAPEEVLGLGAVTPVAPTTREILGAVATGGEPYETELDYEDPRFGPRSFAFQFRALRSGARIVGVLVRSSETTQHRMHSRAVRLQTRMLQAMSDAVFVVDAARTIRFANRACEALFARGSGQLVGEPLAALGEIVDTYVRRAGEVATDGSPSPATTLVLSPAGTGVGASPTIVRCRTSVLTIDRIRHELVVLTDVTELRRLEREVLEAERRERERLARDLHDGIGQELTGVALMLRVLATQLTQAGEPQAAQMERVLEAVNGLVRNSRTLTHGIFGAPVEGAGLENALARLAERASERSGLDVRFRARGRRRHRLDVAVSEQIYRIAQEATTNALRHSRASTILIELKVEENRLRLCVSDDGVGIGTRSDDAGSGLRIMRFRAHAAGGELSIGPRTAAASRAMAEGTNGAADDAVVRATSPRGPGTTVECSVLLPPATDVH